VRGSERLHALLEALLARRHRLPAFREIVGEAVDGGVHDMRAAGDIAVPGVDVARDLLEVEEQAILKAEQFVAVAPVRAQQRFDRAARVTLRRDVVVEMIDECRVEGDLLLQARGDQPPDERREPSLEPAGDDRVHERVARLVERRDLVIVVRRGRLRKIERGDGRLVERGQRVVIAPVRLLALAFQAQEPDVERLVFHYLRDDSVSTKAPTASCADMRTGTRAASVESQSWSARAPDSGGGLSVKRCAWIVPPAALIASVGPATIVTL
jgi:hypothetical protein